MGVLVVLAVIGVLLWCRHLRRQKAAADTLAVAAVKVDVGAVSSSSGARASCIGIPMGDVPGVPMGDVPVPPPPITPAPEAGAHTDTKDYI